jgi:lipopolysaccharide cholinephosphotransferase
MNDLQSIQLDILTKFSQVADKAGLEWFAMFGTLLGASRHGGFIPWDDDIDIAMPRRDYDRLRLSSGWFSEPYFLQTPHNDPEAAPRFMRLRRNDTTYITDFPTSLTRGGNMGICIDIFPLDEVPGAISARQLHHSVQRVREQMLSTAALDENANGDIPEFKAEICYGMGGVQGLYSMFADRYEWLCSRHTDEPYLTIPVLGSPRGAFIYEKSWFKTGTFMEFEGVNIPVPSGWREVLVASYPDGLLEPEKRIGKPTYETDDAIVYVNRPYTEYTSRYTDMLDDIQDKRVYLFGAGDSLRIWLERYSQGLNIVCAFDNAESKWNTVAYGIPVRSPNELPRLMDTDSRLIIASIYREEISQQLDNMGIDNYFIFVDGWNYMRGI